MNETKKFPCLLPFHIVHIRSRCAKRIKHYASASYMIKVYFMYVISICIFISQHLRMCVQQSNSTNYIIYYAAYCCFIKYIDLIVVIAMNMVSEFYVYFRPFYDQLSVHFGVF